MQAALVEEVKPKVPVLLGHLVLYRLVLLQQLVLLHLGADTLVGAQHAVARHLAVPEGLNHLQGQDHKGVARTAVVGSTTEHVEANLADPLVVCALGPQLLRTLLSLLQGLLPAQTIIHLQLHVCSLGSRVPVLVNGVAHVHPHALLAQHLNPILVAALALGHAHRGVQRLAKVVEEVLLIRDGQAQEAVEEARHVPGGFGLTHVVEGGGRAQHAVLGQLH
mmetsp:Transcript_17493/g.37801  ORF Transcript_17493/g.37801 Transcript_17493/m.37801 type:complete len:221 (-) Transcript_17493:257-919(-)